MMRSLIFLCLFAIVSCQNNKWIQVWGDEFVGTKLNPKNWIYEVNCWGGGNNEFQCYTPREQNVKVANGSLFINAVLEQTPYQGRVEGCTNNNENSCTWTKDYTSGRIRTAGDGVVDNSWKYGKFEARAKLPKGQHLWPAFWALPTDRVYGEWAGSGEIDIMEYRGQRTSEFEGTLHFGGQWPTNQHQGSGPKDVGRDLSAEFHRYSVEWEESEIRWYLDDTSFHNMTLERKFGNYYNDTRQPFNQRFHLLLNMAIGGGFFNDPKYGTLDKATAAAWPQPVFEVDWVRVYKRPDDLPTDYVNTLSGDPEGSNGIALSFGFLTLLSAFLL